MRCHPFGAQAIDEHDFVSGFGVIGDFWGFLVGVSYGVQFCPTIIQDTNKIKNFLFGFLLLEVAVVDLDY